MGGIVDTISNVVGDVGKVAGGVNSAFGGNLLPAIGGAVAGSEMPNVPNLSSYNLTSPGTADAGILSLINQNVGSNPANNYLPQILAAFNNRGFYNSGTKPMEAAIPGIQSMMSKQGTGDVATANLLRNLLPQILGNASGIMNTAMDPQQELFKRTQQQLQDQVRTGQAARGTTMTPYGAGLEDQAMSNFDIDWQNNQLSRQTQGASAYGNLMNLASGTASAASNLGTTGAGMQQNAAMLPYSFQQTVAAQKEDAIKNLLSSLGIGQGFNEQSINDYSKYLNMAVGTSQTQAGYQQQQFTDAMDRVKALLGGMGGLSSGAGGGSSGGSGLQDAASLASIASMFF